MSPDSRNRRRSRKHSRHVPPSLPTSNWELRHSPYTAEGRVEGAYRFAVGARNVTGWKRRVLIGFGLLFPVGIGLALVGEIVAALVRWIR